MAAATASVAEQISQAEAYKEEGNVHFKDGNYKRALGAYHKVFCYVNGLSNPSEAGGGGGGGGDGAAAPAKKADNQIPKDRVEDVKKLKKSTRLNMAACYLKVEEHGKCVEACSKALELGSDPKAYFRRGQAYLELRNLSGAKADLERARELTPGDPAIIAELRKLRSALGQDVPRAKRKKAATAESQSTPTEVPSDGPKIEEIVDEGEAAGASTSATETETQREAPPEEEGEKIANGVAEDDEATAMPEQPESNPSTDLTTRDEASKPEVVVRELTYSWHQTDDDIKIYVPFDQSEELEGGVDESRMQCEFGEWSLLLVIRSPVDGRAPLGLRLGDFHRRVVPDSCTCTVRANRITLKLVKRVKENWWNFLQHAPLHTD